VKLLLDTHTALWLFNEYEKLTDRAKDLLLNETNDLYISIVSAWEIAIKTSLGKLVYFSGGVTSFLFAINQYSIDMLPIMPSHIELVEKLPFIHRDPFDRLLVATAKADGMTIVTADDNIHQYDVSSMW
jgi:PIN domain nuclease of toxin-antitoxin system